MMTNDISKNAKFRAILSGLGLELHSEFCELAEDLIRECARIAKRNQDWNDSSVIKLNIDQCILNDFDLRRK